MLWLKTFLELSCGIPSHDTFGRVFAMTRPEEFESCFLNWVRSVFDVTEGQIIPIDGPTNFAIIRHIALNLLKQEKTMKAGIKGKRLRAGWDDDYLLKVLNL
ncbi:MAG: transposase family protein [Desulfobacterales bacterium]|nr:transposase family protein [Desulfobacterales bacterium]